jgi:hypothetical protein
MKTTIPTDPKKLAAWLKRAPEPWALSATAPAARKRSTKTCLAEAAGADGGTMKLELREFTILQ